jgi:peptidase E
MLCAFGQAAHGRQDPSQGQSSDEVLRIDTELVQTGVTVFDDRGRFVDGLKREDFELRVDGRPVPISFFENILAGSPRDRLARVRGKALMKKGVMSIRFNRRRFLAGAAVASASLAWDSPLAAREKTPAKRRIFAGGGGLTASNNTLLMEYLLALTGKKEPVVYFLPTATGDSPSTVMSWYELMNGLPCRPKHLRLFGSSRLMREFGPRLLSADAIFVGPGSTLNMLALWMAQGVDAILRRAWEQGVILGGESAGLNCWFEQSVTDSRPERLTAMDGLGFLKGSVCPHYDSERQRKPSYHQMMLSGEVREGIACDDWVGLLYEGDALARVVSSRPEKTAYRVRLAGGKVVEEPLKAEFLGKTP